MSLLALPHARSALVASRRLARHAEAGGPAQRTNLSARCSAPYASEYIATAAVAATLSESMPWRIGICTMLSAASIASRVSP